MSRCESLYCPHTINDNLVTTPTMRGRIILIDDDAEILAAIRSLLELEDYICETYSSALSYLRVQRTEPMDEFIPSCVLCDVKMPELGGLELQRRLAEHNDAPMLLMSGASGAQEVTAAFRAGAVDFLLKPIDIDVLLAAIATALEISCQRRRWRNRNTDLTARISTLTEGECQIARLLARGQSHRDIAEMLNLPLELVNAQRQQIMAKMGVKTLVELVRVIDDINLHLTAEGQPRRVWGTLHDVASQQAKQEEFQQLAHYDHLTHLPNRRLFLERLHQALADSARHHAWGALVFIDLDNFKHINDHFGHDVGDQLLQQVAQRLLSFVRGNDTVARLGGDEFVIIFKYLNTDHVQAVTYADQLGKKILNLLNPPYLIAGHAHQSTPSIGIAHFNGQTASLETVMKQADAAMYQAKERGRNCVCHFDTNLQEALTTREALAADLLAGLDSGQFHLHYQTQVNTDGKITGVEALVRWRHPEHGWIPPDELIPLAERSGLILPLTQWILETACQQLFEWSRIPALEPLNMAVNISTRQFYHPDFVDTVQDILKQCGANPQRLRLELTEDLLLTDIKNSFAKMTALKKSGISFVLDNFGTGYSSLSALRQLPLDGLKIAPDFVNNVLTSPGNSSLPIALISLMRSLGIEVMAEGIENQQQREFLTEQGCLTFQGYLFGYPTPIESLTLN
ncbi:EAL domain-containing protein [Chromatium okenii]|nr:EAL domain-containing protein [Chromatium okenii]